MLARCLRIVTVVLVAPFPLLAQEATAPWRTTIEASGNVLYGAASQRVISGSIALQQMSQRRQVRADLLAGYGDARDLESGERRVIVRQTRASTSLDLTPQARVSPFFFSLAENSLQQRIRSRYSGGAGAKLTFWRADSVRAGFLEDASVSMAVLGEQTLAVPRPGVPDAGSGAGARYRWSARARVRRRLGDALRLTHLLLYQPTVDRIGRYTLEATTTLAVPVAARTEFTVTHRERLDSEARDRGAPSNRDGQLLFGIRSAF
ncbi:hypothetical protein MASR1M101_01620 [Gemmatimonas sp.]